MPDYIIDGDVLTGIADEIRSKTWDTGQITPESMREKIAGLSKPKYEIWTITYADGTVEEKEVAVQ